MKYEREERVAMERKMRARERIKKLQVELAVERKRSGGVGRSRSMFSISGDHPLV